MQRSARVVLWRRWPPGFRSVTVRSLSVGRFLALSERACALALEIKLKLNRQLTKEDILNAPLSTEQWADLADFACPDEAPGWFRAWFTRRNLSRLLRRFGDVRMGGVNDWRRITANLNLAGEGRREGSVHGAIARLCSRYPGLTPFDVYARDVVEFFDMVDGVIETAPAGRRAAAGDEPVTFAALSDFDGLGVH